MHQGENETLKIKLFQEIERHHSFWIDSKEIVSHKMEWSTSLKVFGIKIMACILFVNYCKLSLD